jgi:lactocepin
LVYTGGIQTGVAGGAGYTVKNGTAVEAGDYTATVSLADKTTSTWDDGTTGDLTIAWSIAAATPTPTPTPTPTTPATVTRLSGATALDTMSAIVNCGFSGTGGTVVLATGAGYWDALTAAGIAGLADAPVMLTSIDGKSLSKQTITELKRLAPATIIVCGGNAAVPNSLVSAAESAAGTSPRVVRCFGDNAIGTANDIYKKAASATGKSFGDTAFIATNDGYWDALACAPYSYSHGAPIFLTSNGANAKAGKDSVSADTLSTMKAGGIKNVYIVGGTAAVSDNVKSQLAKAGFTVKQRLAGNTAVETSAAIANFELACGMQVDKMAVATTGDFYDALTGAALCGKNGSVLVLANDANRSSIAAVVKPNKNLIGTAYIFGGSAAVSNKSKRILTMC